MSGTLDDVQNPSLDSLRDESTNPVSTKDAAAYARYRITEDLHPAFADTGIDYNTQTDSFAADVDEIYDEATLFDSQKAFANALEQFQQGIKCKYKSKIDLRESHSWDEVMKYANEARDKYTGIDKRGITKKINNKLKTFQTAAPAIQAWLKLLPSTSTYGSIVCGGLTIILEVSC